ncbi:MAG: RNA-binding protein [Rhodobacterales bacterium 65-51]|nr:MAG: RNA-binding protein [Rhodobacterales bacterium 65-51]
MTEDSRGDTPRPDRTQRQGRRMRGFEAASGLLKDRIRSAGESRGFAVTRLLTHWPDVVGADLARITRPVKVGFARGAFGATLTLLVKPTDAPMVQMQLPRIKERVNACYGYAAIGRITLTQTAPSGFAEGQAQFAPAPPAAPKPVAPEIAREARATAEGVQDEGLRSALETLAQNILTRRKS